MSPTGRCALLLTAVAVSALLLPAVVVVAAALAVVAATVVDAVSVRGAPSVTRAVPSTLARGVAVRLTVDVGDGQGTVRIRQPLPPDMTMRPSEADGRLDGELVPRRRGRHLLPAVRVRRTGPLGLGRWDHAGAGDCELLVFPDVPAARRLAQTVREGRSPEQGRRRRGPLGLGTEFELIRDYVPDDDVRQVNWLATNRLDRPMSNVFRVEQDREVVCVVDTGRLMAAPLGDRTRLDAALDAAVAVALVADAVGDRCGAVAFADEVRRRLAPRRGGGRAVVEALFDLEPEPVESDYELAFRTVAGSKRAFVLVLTDLLDEAAARPLVEAVPVLSRRHSVAVATVDDPDLVAAVRTRPRTAIDAYGASVAVELLEARRRVAHELRRAGATVVEAGPDGLASGCVGAYLRAKATARL